MITEGQVVWAIGPYFQAFPCTVRCVRPSGWLDVDAGENQKLIRKTGTLRMGEVYISGKDAARDAHRKISRSIARLEAKAHKLITDYGLQEEVKPPA